MVVERNAQRFDELCKRCPQCTIVGRAEQRNIPPLIPTYDHPFQIVGVDIMELLLTAQENKCLIVFKTFFTKWPMAFPAPDQKLNELCDCLLNR